MKKVQVSILESLNRVVLFQNDLEELVTFLQSDGSKVTIADNSAEYDDLAELVANKGPGRIKELTITLYTPHVSIRLSPLLAEIYIHGDDAKALGICSRCKEILRRRAKLRGFFSSYSFLFPMAVVIEVIEHFFHTPYWIEPLLVSFFIWSLLATYMRLTRHSFIMLSRADSIDAFWSRNKDDLLRSAITGGIGVIVGILVQRFVLSGYFHWGLK